ncbi:ATP-binding cassette domain-containing protein [Rathayibacter sp. VKM Ac-2803]|uniref:ABC transporter transmembrane domain-containing protein n=1 Tax=Rathayibacter sp. VKM Ac-2803 TaxID=2609256 RepID=UPI00135C4C78|nr:ABC transporter ATP-binding protein [Rathayibacter sp. VKM Ac-2803]MWV50713.1 ATP-binding cassette domain-containing protein [Rathayibacter sp. VKM Ac-2803]
MRPAALFRSAAAGGGRGWRLLGGASGFAGHQLAEVLVPVAVGVVIEQAVGPGDGGALLGTLGVLVAVFALLITSWQVGDRLLTRVHAEGEHALRQRIVGAVLRGSGVRRAPGEVLTIASADAAQVAGVSWVVAELAGAIAALVASAMVLASISWQLVAGVVVCTLGQLALVHVMSARLRSRSYEAQRRAARIDALGTDFALGLRALQALGATRAAGARYRAESAEAARAMYRADRAEAALSLVGTLATGIAFASVVALAGALLAAGSIGVGEFVIGVGLAQAVRRPLQTIGYLPGAVAAKHGSARRIGELLEQTPPLHGGAESGPTETCAVEFTVGPRRVEVAPGAVLGVRADEATALALADLLGARRAPRAGELVVDGRDASELGAADLRRLVFAPPHDAVLFSGSLRENVRPEGALDDAVIAASGLDEVVTRLPRGVEETVGDRGGLLSGGQRQRVLLARALSTDQPVVVLHDPTTAIDPVTESRIARLVIARLRAQHRSVVLITTSAALLGVCDIVVTERGA